MRKQKFEAEMKEVQSKPKISAKSRVLAVQAERKYFETAKISERPQQEVKRYCDDELIELEEDIQLLEECLNMEKPRILGGGELSSSKNMTPFYQFNTADQIRTDEREGKKKIIATVKKSKTVMVEKSPNKPPMHNVNREKRRIMTESPIKFVNNTPQRRFIKRNNEKKVKERSSSMETLTEINFAYRSLSPYQVSIKRS